MASSLCAASREAPALAVITSGEGDVAATAITAGGIINPSKNAVMMMRVHVLLITIPPKKRHLDRRPECTAG
jgi:hypothetical protein